MRVLDVILTENQNPVQGSSLTAGQWTNVYINSQRFRFVDMDTQAQRDVAIDRFLRDIGQVNTPARLITKLRRHGIDIPPNLTSFEAVDQSLQTMANTEPNLGAALGSTAPDRRSERMQGDLASLRSAVPGAAESFDTAESAEEYMRNLVNWIREQRGEEFVSVIDGDSAGARQAVTSLVQRIETLKGSLPISKQDIDNSFYEWLLIADRVVRANQY